MIDLTEINAVTGAATTGPWEIDSSLRPFEIIHAGSVSIATMCVMPDSYSNADFIAAARDWVPQLVARVEELEAEIEQFPSFENCAYCDQPTKPEIVFMENETRRYKCAACGNAASWSVTNENARRYWNVAQWRAKGMRI